MTNAASALSSSDVNACLGKDPDASLRDLGTVLDIDFPEPSASLSGGWDGIVVFKTNQSLPVCAFVPTHRDNDAHPRISDVRVVSHAQECQQRAPVEIVQCIVRDNVAASNIHAPDACTPLQQPDDAVICSKAQAVRSGL